MSTGTLEVWTILIHGRTERQMLTEHPLVMIEKPHAKVCCPSTECVRALQRGMFGFLRFFHGKTCLLDTPFLAEVCSVVAYILWCAINFETAWVWPYIHWSQFMKRISRDRNSVREQESPLNIRETDLQFLFSYKMHDQVQLFSQNSRRLLRQFPPHEHTPKSAITASPKVPVDSQEWPGVARKNSTIFPGMTLQLPEKLTQRAHSYSLPFIFQRIPYAVVSHVSNTPN